MSQKNVFGKLLSNKPLILIGKISFSLYLIHQPVFAFYRIFKYRDVSRIEEFVLIVICFLLSYLMWKLVEEQFRYKFELKTLIFLFTIIIFNSITYIASNNDGYASRYSGFSSEISDELIYGENYELYDLEGNRCFNSACYLDFGENKNMILIGDSHMWYISKDIKDLAQNNNFNFYTYIQGGCVFTNYSYAQKYGCQFNEDSTFENIKEINPDAILFGARLPVYVNGTCMDTGNYIEKNCGGYYLNRTVPNLSPEESLPFVIEDIKYTLNFLKKILIN